MCGSSPARNVALKADGLEDACVNVPPIVEVSGGISIGLKGLLCSLLLTVRKMLSPSVNVWFKSSRE